jgi:hypothetical protein
MEQHERVIMSNECLDQNVPSSFQQLYFILLLSSTLDLIHRTLSLQSFLKQFMR